MNKEKLYTETHTIWIDLTDIVEWRGNYTGIQRTQMQLAERFYNYFPKSVVRFFRHDYKHYAFSEVDFEAFLSDQAVRKSNNLPKDDGTQSSLLSDKTPKKLIIKAMKSTLPIAAVKSIIIARGLLIKRRDNRVRAQTKINISTPFAANDKIMILGGNWGSELFLEALLLAKQTIDFKLYHVLYDLIPLAQPAYAPIGVTERFADYMELVFQNSNGVFAISESTKHDAEAFIIQKKIKPACHITIFRLGDNFQVSEPVRPANRVIRKNEFILCVGTFEVRKNYMLLYYVVKEAKRRGITLPLIVIVGKAGWLVHDTIHLFNLDPDLKGKVLHLQKANDQQLSWLYKNCQFTVFPSLYEGWGLPVAESVFYNKLCLSSNAASMPEIAGVLIDYFAPTSVEECLNKIVHYSTHPNDLKQKETIIQANYHPTSWDESFSQLLANLYKQQS